MNYLPYATKKSTPNRKTRKGARNTVFIKNKKSKKLLKSQARRERRLAESE